jgi:hypothetical protein
VPQKIARTAVGYKFAGGNFANLRIMDWATYGASYRPSSERKTLEGLLNYQELMEDLKHRDDLTGELGKIAERLRALAPHLL